MSGKLQAHRCSGVWCTAFLGFEDLAIFFLQTIYMPRMGIEEFSVFESWLVRTIRLLVGMILNGVGNDVTKQGSRQARHLLEQALPPRRS